MARRSLNDRSIRKLGKTHGGSVYLTIPIEIIRELKWRDGQKVVVKKIGSSVVVEDWKK